MLNETFSVIFKHHVQYYHWCWHLLLAWIIIALKNWWLAASTDFVWFDILEFIDDVLQEKKQGNVVQVGLVIPQTKNIYGNLKKGSRTRTLSDHLQKKDLDQILFRSPPKKKDLILGSWISRSKFDLIIITLSL